jgi:hypothetical protein
VYLLAGCSPGCSSGKKKKIISFSCFQDMEEEPVSEKIPSPLIPSNSPKLRRSLRLSGFQDLGSSVQSPEPRKPTGFSSFQDMDVSGGKEVFYLTRYLIHI